MIENSCVLHKQFSGEELEPEPELWCQSGVENVWRVKLSDTSLASHIPSTPAARSRMWPFVSRATHSTRSATSNLHVKQMSRHMKGSVQA